MRKQGHINKQFMTQDSGRLEYEWEFNLRLAAELNLENKAAFFFFFLTLTAWWEKNT